MEDAADKAQTAEMLASKDRQIAEQAALIESQKKDIKRISADLDIEHDARIKAEEEKKAFMYSLYESCKLNDLNFFDYINDVLTRLMKGETDYKSLIPCNYKPLPKDDGEGQKEAA